MPALCCVLSVSLLAGCGGSSGSTSNGSNGAVASTAASSGAAGHAGLGAGSQPGPGGTAGGGSAASAAAKPAKLPSGTVAKADGIAVTLAAYTHQLQISAQGPVKPLNSGASDYPACVAALKSREERTEKLIKAQGEKFAKKSKERVKGSGLLAQPRKPKTDAQRKRQCEQLYKAAKQQAVSNLIRRIWAQAEAKELSVSVSQSEVAKRVKAREASQKAFAKNARFREFLAEVPRYTGNDLREMITDGLVEEKIGAKVRGTFVKAGSVSQEKLEKYFNEHKQAYAQRESRSIVLATSKSEGVAAAIAKEHVSAGLSAAAAKHGIKAMPTSVSCEHIQTKGVSHSPLYSAVCAAKTGVVSGPINSSTSFPKTPATYYVFEVHSIVPALQPSFAQAKDRIKQLLASQGQLQGIYKYNEEIRLKQREKTECAAGYVTPLCKEYVAPKPTSVSKAKAATP